jgi:hypothetical protein
MDGLSVTDPSDFPKDAPGLREIDAALRCTICLEFFDAPTTTACGHCFCSMVSHNMLGCVHYNQDFSAYETSYLRLMKRYALNAGKARQNTSYVQTLRWRTLSLPGEQLGRREPIMYCPFSEIILAPSLHNSTKIMNH